MRSPAIKRPGGSGTRSARSRNATKIQRFFKKNLLFKYYTLDERIKYFNYVQRHLRNVNKNSCLVSKKFGPNKGFTIDNIIDLEKQIGRASKYGAIFKTSVKGMLGRFPIATKLMEIEEDNTRELKLYVAFSNYIMKRKLSRHFLLCYKSFQCKKKGTNVPKVIQKTPYHISLNEIAQGDLWNLCLTPNNDYNTQFLQDDALVLNVVIQCLLSIATFHKLGWIHQDCHAGNFLYHLTENKEGYYHYKILGKSYYLKNCGYTMMIYDFGLAEPYKNSRPYFYDHYDGQFNNRMFRQDNDTNRPFIYDYYDYRNMMRTFWKEYCYGSMTPAAKAFISDVLNLSAPNRFANEDEMIRAMCELFATGCPVANLWTDTLPAGQTTVNSEPFIIDATLKRFLPNKLTVMTPKLPSLGSTQSRRSLSKESQGSEGSNDEDDDNDDDEDDLEDEENDVNSTAECIRNRSNFSAVKAFHMIDKKEFDGDMLNMYIDNGAAPKLKTLLKNIKKLDAKDMRTTGKQFKHIIFTDVNRSAYGVKIIASALAANDMHMAQHPQGPGFSVHPDEKLLETKGSNFAVLISKAFYDRPLNVKTRKIIMDKFNSRPDNVNGDLIRFIVLDQGFKEGIDLYDVKYVHLLEPLAVPADEKQAIGRGTRFCGQKGLEFHPRFGWPLYVFKYDATIPENLRAQHFSNAQTLFNLYLKYSNIDLRKIVFAAELENAAIEASVDYDLNRRIHTFTVEKPSPVLSASRGSKGSRGGATPQPPRRKMNLEQMREYIRENFSDFSYSDIRLENKCIDGGSTSGGNGTIVSFTPTQNFVRHYFQPSSAYKGALFWHSVGTGKTCSAIATATTSFDAEGYTILWVTRHTLKSDIWKNMYNQVCSIDVQNKIRNGLVLPKKVRNMQYISGNWMEPISYKQFSNMLLKKNKIYNQIVSRNGAEDPLRKTLLIIDEAHKLYSPTVAKSEKPDTDILEKMIQNSYNKSGDDSVRVLLMTATPFTEDGMEMMKLLNLLRDDGKLEVDFNKFSGAYLDDQGYFTVAGRNKFQNEISGYISYLNRSQDARNFAHPVIQNMLTEMSVEKDEEKPKSKYDVNLKELRANAKQAREMLKELKADKKADVQNLKEAAKEKHKECVEEVKAAFDSAMEEAKEIKKEKEAKCKTLPVKNRKECKDRVAAAFKDTQQKLKDQKATELDECKELKQRLVNASNMNKKIDDLQKELDEYREQIKVVGADKKGRNAMVKDIRNHMKELKAEAKEAMLESKNIAARVKNRLNQIKKIQDKKQRQEAMKNFRQNNADVKRLKELKTAVRDLRSKITIQNNKIQNMHFFDGKKKLKNVSQQYALQKYCKI
jgi:hypothetical protein